MRPLILLIIMLFIFSCASHNSAQYSRDYSQQGAIAGAISGAIIGKIIGDNTSGMLIGAAIGITAGAALGNKIKKIQLSNEKPQKKLRLQIFYLNLNINNAKKNISIARKSKKLISLKLKNNRSNNTIKHLGRIISSEERAVYRLRADLSAHKQLISSVKSQSIRGGVT